MEHNIGNLVRFQDYFHKLVVDTLFESYEEALRGFVLNSITGKDCPTESEIEEGLLILRAYWWEKLEEGPIPSKELWKKSPNSLEHIAFYTGTIGIFDRPPDNKSNLFAIRLYDKRGNLYYALPGEYEGLITEEQHERLEAEKLNGEIALLRNIWTELLERKGRLSSSQMVQAAPINLQSVAVLMGKGGINGILAGYGKITKTETHYELAR